MKTIEQIVNTYFNDHPEEKDDVIKASYAFPSSKLKNTKGEHRWPRFPEIGWDDLSISRSLDYDPFFHLRDDQCMACGRTRWQVRHDNQSPECSKWQSIEIEETISSEEELFFSLIEKSKPTIDKIIKKMGLSGETLAFLHHTHGIDIEIVETHIEINDALREEYRVEWEKHKSTGGKFR